MDEFLELWFKTENNIDKRVVKIINQLKKKRIKCILATNQEKYRTKYFLEKGQKSLVSIQGFIQALTVLKTILKKLV